MPDLKCRQGCNESRWNSKQGCLGGHFHPEDLNALEQALRLKDRYNGSTVTLNNVQPVLLTLFVKAVQRCRRRLLAYRPCFCRFRYPATSYALSCAIRKIKDYDLIIAGRQAIDGDTASIATGCRETWFAAMAEEILSAEKGKIKIKRRLERGVETVESPYPAVITVNGSAAACRPRSAALMKYKHARTMSERQTQSEDYIAQTGIVLLHIAEWGVNDVETDSKWLG